MIVCEIMINRVALELKLQHVPLDKSIRKWYGFYPAILLIVGAAACGRFSSEPVIARVGHLVITESEFQRKLSEVSSGYKDYVLTPHGRKQFLDVLIREKMKLAAAMESDVPKSPEFKEEMARLRAEVEARVREGREFLLTRFWEDNLRKQGLLRASDDEVRAYHKKHPVEIHIRHILLATPEKAAGLAKRLRRKRSVKLFAALAKKHSLDADSASDGGRMQPAIYGEIVPDLEDVVFSMKPGDVSQPIRSKFGYHVIMKESQKWLSFDIAKGRIIRVLESKKLDEYLESIQSKFPVEVVDEQFK